MERRADGCYARRSVTYTSTGCSGCFPSSRSTCDLGGRAWSGSAKLARRSRMIVPRRPDADSPGGRGPDAFSPTGGSCRYSSTPVAVIPEWRALGNTSSNTIRGEHEIANMTERGARRPVSRRQRVGEAASPTPAGPRREMAQSERRRETVGVSKHGPAGRPWPQCPRDRWVGLRLQPREETRVSESLPEDLGRSAAPGESVLHLDGDAGRLTAVD